MSLGDSLWLQLVVVTLFFVPFASSDFFLVCGLYISVYYSSSSIAAWVDDDQLWMMISYCAVVKINIYALAFFQLSQYRR